MVSNDFNNLGQLGLTLDEREKLFPFPQIILNSDFSMGRSYKLNETGLNKYEVQFKLISPVELLVKVSSNTETFKTYILEGNPNFKYKRSKGAFNSYEMSLKHYFYVLSRVRYIRTDVFVTNLNYNRFETNFIKALIKNLSFNENIIKFIEKPKKRNSKIDSLISDPKFGKPKKTIIENNMFEDLYEHQIISFYMSVIREGKCILSDKAVTGRAGKSLTAITVMAYFREDWPLVIVCKEERKKYWSDELLAAFNGGKGLRISIINDVKDIYVYPKPFHDIMVINYDLYYQIKDTISFLNLKIKAFIFEDQCRGIETSSNRQWRGLSDCFDNLKKALRIVFISSKEIPLDNCKRLWPLLHILDPILFEDYDKFIVRYDLDDLSEDDPKRHQLIKELQILLRSTFLIKNNCD